MHNTVFVVEDDNAVRETLVEALELLGYRVDAAANGKEALDSLEHRDPPPCLILLDLMMPVMDGWQFRAKQQADPKLSKIPVVVFSADGGVSQKAQSMNAAGSLRKPVDLKDLKRVVSEFC